MRLVACVILATALGACGISGPQLAGYDGLQIKVVRYYDNHASEKGGQCLRPEMGAITNEAVVEDTKERLVVRLRYSWQDNTYERRRPGVMFRTCEGFDERDFTIAKNDGRLEVVAMTGPTRQKHNFGG